MTTQTSGLVTGVDFVSIPVADIERTADWYEQVLGLERTSAWQGGGETPMGIEFETGTVTFVLFAAAAFGIPFAPARVPIALQVDDVPAAVAALEARGVAFKGELIDSGVCHMRPFEDPEGNSLLLHHRYAPKG